MHFYVAEQPMWVAVKGADAKKVVNNLCTADIVQLGENESTECFVTDVRGRVVAFAICHVAGESVNLLGTHPDPQAVANHIDRYIIREAAEVTDCSPDSSILLADAPPSGLELGIQVPARLFVGGGWLIGVAQNECSTAEQHLSSTGFERLSPYDAELKRIEAFWPNNGTEIGEKSLPQELDRDAVAISFTKGCYLGQETVARLDARGQLQKKLCLVGSDTELAVGGELTDGDKVVGKLYSVTKRPDEKWLGLANMRRGYFEPGTTVYAGQAAVNVQDIPSFDQPQASS
ncbi:MAG TPA: hypothetical protein DDW52_12595 [Planctomycetaceae bacterium]|nr:hypothetical protein [Planctomycetaceae bacterium]